MELPAIVTGSWRQLAAGDDMAFSKKYLNGLLPGATFPKGAKKQPTRIAAVTLLLAAISSPLAHAHSDAPPRDTSYDADSLAGWVQFLELVKSTKGPLFTDETLRSRYGQDVKKTEREDRSYMDVVDYTKADHHGFRLVLEYTARPIGVKNYASPGSALHVYWPGHGCIDRDKARADLVAAGFAFVGTQPFAPPIDAYSKGRIIVRLALWTAQPARRPTETANHEPMSALVCVKDATAR